MIKKKKSKGRNNIAKLNKYNCDNDAKRIPGSPKLRLLCIGGKEKGYPNCLRDLLMLRESCGKATTNRVKERARKTCIWLKGMLLHLNSTVNKIKPQNREKLHPRILGNVDH